MPPVPPNRSGRTIVADHPAYDTPAAEGRLAPLLTIRHAGEPGPERPL
ncbi:MAG: hypothetical protein AVDCRST_MAG19-4429 [uncultured Thermomicrobiales bacterium]|uniref:Uncharacterized protein n=1 Tax=uncultured Thermomicrobiales bacterium TaxID=1645740 RepID=A0A6J4VP03_9BACT|nr:MAG: hypothetical protein AVDCRST_MAG19-4429 [uncultured Thermomicrobiales bacterium]